MLPIPNLLATRVGRLVAFFFLYVTEGVPLGFTAVAVAVELRERGVDAGTISAFVGILYLPWSWKWVLGPVVDLVYSERFGRRRLWIVAAQTVMALGLLAGMGIDLDSQLGLFTGLVLLINVFGATQDVAIDALACGVLEEKERGLANGVMFAGAYAGQMLGGAGVLFLADWIGFESTFFFVTACILAVTVFVALPLKEPRSSQAQVRSGARPRAIGAEIATYLRDVRQAFLGTRSALLAAVFGLLPTGTLALSMALQTNLAVEIGLGRKGIGTLNLITAGIAATCCVLGGYLSDRFGRRRMLALFIVGTAIPGLVLAYYMKREGWTLPVDPTAVDRPPVPAVLVTCFWTTCIVFAVFQGLLYGTRIALFMDVCTPEVAATQFTAYMALPNLVLVYTGLWQGFTIRNFGYPTTLLIDGIVGLLCLGLLPWIRKVDP